MAKGSAMGLWKGKKGSSVFYRIANSNSAQKQGIRERNYEVANPQSSGQAGQRMRMYPAQAVYNVIKDVIERSWQGIKYGEDARREFLKGALRQSVFAAVSKGMGVVPPSPYQIAKGSLIEFPATLSDGSFVVSIPSTAPITWEESTVGELATAILEQNPQLKAGDQITFVVCTRDNNAKNFAWEVASFFLDTASTQLINTVFTRQFEVATTTSTFTLSHGSTSPIVGAAIIISRDGTTPMRSNARLVVDFSALSDYYIDSAIADARKSYMKPVSEAQRDWPADPATPEVTGATLSTYTIAGLTGTNAIFNGAVVQVYRKDTDDSLVAVPVLTGSGENTEQTIESGPCLVGEDGQLLERTRTVQSEEVSYNLLVSVVTELANLRQVPFTPGE